jgi:hypothetical protein
MKEIIIIGLTIHVLFLACVIFEIGCPYLVTIFGNNESIIHNLAIISNQSLTILQKNSPKIEL